MGQAAALIDDMTGPTAATGTLWECVSDGVMGGLSQGSLRRHPVKGRMALHLTGSVNLANNGGFVQAALDLTPGGGPIDARGWRGIRMAVCGNAEDYNLHLRTSDITRPWQSYRHGFTAPAEWTDITLDFAEFAAHRTEAPLDLSRLRRIGMVAIGRAFQADLAVADLRFI